MRRIEAVGALPGESSSSSGTSSARRRQLVLTEQAPHIRRLHCMGDPNPVAALLGGIDSIERPLVGALRSYNQNFKPFAWTATADSILAKLHRLCARISRTAHWYLIGRQDRRWMSRPGTSSSDRSTEPLMDSVQ